MVNRVMNFMKSKPKEQEAFKTVVDGLKKVYFQKLLPLEKQYKFHEFHSPPLEEADFDARPMVLLIGQYSTGKTTFIRYLLQQDFPGMRIGPEPTTDRFIAIMHSEQETVVPGNALITDPKKQFRPLSRFGNNFLNRLQCSCLPNSVLESITLIDTPGILSGEKHRVDRGYDFTGVIQWFAERVDRIILLFDAHKLDISDEFKRSIECLKEYEDKIRIILNKADQVDAQQLMRVYGALMWSLGKVLHTPEVARVYLGSFWDQPLHYDSNQRLFELESRDLFQDLQTLPGNAALRKLNDLIRRARLAKVQAYLISHLRDEMPAMIGKDAKKRELIANLGRIYEKITRELPVSMGDFPRLEKMQEALALQDFKAFSPLRPKMIEAVDDMLTNDIARLMQMIPQEKETHRLQELQEPSRVDGAPPSLHSSALTGGVFQQYNSPFGVGVTDGINAGKFDEEWVVSKERYEYDQAFENLRPTNGKLSGAAAKDHMVRSKLPYNVLGKIWKLADVDSDGSLDADEFALACYLIKLKLDGIELPGTLPPHLIPPSKRQVGTN